MAKKSKDIKHQRKKAMKLLKTIFYVLSVFYFALFIYFGALKPTLRIEFDSNLSSNVLGFDLFRERVFESVGSCKDYTLKYRFDKHRTEDLEKSIRNNKRGGGGGGEIEIERNNHTETRQKDRDSTLETSIDIYTRPESFRCNETKYCSKIGRVPILIYRLKSENAFENAKRGSSKEEDEDDFSNDGFSNDYIFSVETFRASLSNDCRLLRRRERAMDFQTTNSFSRFDGKNKSGLGNIDIFKSILIPNDPNMVEIISKWIPDDPCGERVRDSMISLDSMLQGVFFSDSRKTETLDARFFSKISQSAPNDFDTRKISRDSIKLPPIESSSYWDRFEWIFLPFNDRILDTMASFGFHPLRVSTNKRNEEEEEEEEEIIEKERSCAHDQPCYPFYVNVYMSPNPDYYKVAMKAHDCLFDDRLITENLGILPLRRNSRVAKERTDNLFFYS